MEKFLDEIGNESGIYLNTKPSLIKGLFRELSKYYRTFKEVANYSKTDERNVRIE